MDLDCFRGTAQLTVESFRWREGGLEVVACVRSLVKSTKLLRYSGSRSIGSSLCFTSDSSGFSAGFGGGSGFGGGGASFGGSFGVSFTAGFIGDGGRNECRYSGDNMRSPSRRSVVARFAKGGLAPPSCGTYEDLVSLLIINGPSRRNCVRRLYGPLCAAEAAAVNKSPTNLSAVSERAAEVSDSIFVSCVNEVGLRTIGGLSVRSGLMYFAHISERISETLPSLKAPVAPTPSRLLPRLNARDNS